jgi:hypothetical protein
VALDECPFFINRVEITENKAFSKKWLLIMNTSRSRQAIALIEMLAVIFILGVTSVVFGIVRKVYGMWALIGATMLTASVCAIIVYYFYRWSWRRDEQKLRQLREEYRGIYRVLVVPSDPNLITAPAGATIIIGDYGWETAPIHKEGLIYLQGLTREWTVVWHAGFQPDQIERIATKPVSQYDYWHPYWADSPLPAACPFPVIERETLTMGLPHHSNEYFFMPSPYPARKTEKNDNDSKKA